MKTVFAILGLITSSLSVTAYGATAPTCASLFLAKPKGVTAWERNMDFRDKLEKAIIQGKDVSQLYLISDNLDVIQESLNKMPAAIGANLSKKIDNLRRFKRMTYKNYAEISSEYFFISNNQTFLIGKDMSSPEIKKKLAHFKAYLRDIDFTYDLNEGWIQMPIRTDLSVRELNQLWVLGIHPMGLIEGTARVDGTVFNAPDFLAHDGAHSKVRIGSIASQSYLEKTPFRKILVQTAEFYNKLQTRYELEGLPKYLQDFIEVEFFIYIHEIRSRELTTNNTFYSVKYDNGQVKSAEDLKIEAVRLQKELTDINFVRHRLFGYKNGRKLTEKDFYDIMVFFSKF